MFFGQYEHNLDDKNRLMIPSKMRGEIGSKLYILKGFDGSLSVYKSETFEKLVSEINNLPYNLRNSRDYLRLTLGSVSEMEVDRLGRIQIPTSLISKFNISKNVVVIGVGDHFEIWNKATYNEYENKVNKEYENIAENLHFDSRE